MANTQVSVIEIEVEGIKYTQTRPGYYYKRVDGKNVRIPKSEWEQAFDAFTAEVNEADEEFDAEDEIRARKEAEEQKDRETEQNFNGKKTAKPRRSKDVAFEMDTIEGHITLTAKQVQFLKLLPKTCFWEEGVESTLWCDCIADDIGWNPMGVGAMISTLREKRMVTVDRDESRQGKPKYITFTDLGKTVMQKMGLN